MTDVERVDANLEDRLSPPSNPAPCHQSDCSSCRRCRRGRDDGADVGGHRHRRRSPSATAVPSPGSRRNRRRTCWWRFCYVSVCSFWFWAALLSYSSSSSSYFFGAAAATPPPPPPRKLHQIPPSVFAGSDDVDYGGASVSGGGFSGAQLRPDPPSGAASAVGSKTSGSPSTARDADGGWALNTLRRVLDIPAPPPAAGPGRRQRRRAAPPQYMLDLYNQIADSNGITVGENPYGAKIVRSFRLVSGGIMSGSSSHVPPSPAIISKGANSTSGSPTTQARTFGRLRLEFSLTGVRASESLIEAELHLYRAKHMLLFEPKDVVDVYQLHVHEVIRKRRPASTDEETTTSSHLSTRLVSVRDGQRWEVFRVGSSASLAGGLWRRLHHRFGGRADDDDDVDDGGRRTVTFVVTATTVDGRPLALAGANGRHSKQPFLVLYNDDGTPATYTVATGARFAAGQQGDRYDSEFRHKRSPNEVSSSTTTTTMTSPNPAASSTDSSDAPSSISTSSSPIGATSSSPDGNDISSSAGQTSSPSPGDNRNSTTTTTTTTPPRPSDPTHPCQRLPLYVDFELIGLENIISPRGYQAFWCHGLCAYPLDQEVSPTNHATVQSFAHHMGLRSSASPAGDDGVRPGSFRPDVAVTAPCCAPSALLSVSILFYGEDGNVALRQYDDMVAASCSCQ